MNELRHRDPNTAVGDVLPQRAPEPAPPTHSDHGVKRYLAPLLLASIAMVINVLAFLAPDPTAPTLEATMERADLSSAQRIKSAEQLKAHGDQLYEEGYSWVNDYDALNGARSAYMDAWELITNRSYPDGSGISDLIADTTQCRVLRDHLNIRLKTLQETFARNRKIMEYLP